MEKSNIFGNNAIDLSRILWSPTVIIDIDPVYPLIGKHEIDFLYFCNQVLYHLVKS